MDPHWFRLVTKHGRVWTPLNLGPSLPATTARARSAGQHPDSSTLALAAHPCTWMDQGESAFSCARRPREENSVTHILPMIKAFCGKNQ